MLKKFNIVMLLILGLAVFPFLTQVGDTRTIKMTISVMVALALGLWAIYSGQIKPFRNKWLLFLMGFFLVSIFFAPKPDVQLWDIKVGNFWVWKTTFQSLAFLLMLIAVASIEFTKENVRNILTVMLWVGFIMSIYAIVQFLNIDQLAGKHPDVIGHEPMQWRVGGTMGQPTIVAPFIAMLIPIALYLKRKVKAVVMGVTVCLSFSQVAIGAMVISLLFFIATKGKRCLVLASAVFIICSLVLGIGYFKSPKIRSFTSGTGRYTHWKQIAKDVNNPLNESIKNKYPWTGLAPGSFKYTYHLRHNNNWHQAHNDYLELAYNNGLIGLIFFLLAIFYMFKQNLSRNMSRLQRGLLSSFVCIGIAAGGTFIYQMGAHAYYLMVICGLLHNSEVMKWL